MVLASAMPEPAPVTETAVQVPMPPKRPIYQVASADTQQPAPAPRPTAPINLASLSPNEIINMRGLWEAQQQPAEAQASETNVSSARRALAASLSGNRDLTAAIKSFANSSDRVPVETALAYAAPDAGNPPAQRAPAVISTNGRASSVAEKPSNIAANRIARAADRLDDPWLRGVILTPSVQSSLIVMRVGELDVTSLAQHMQKPASSVVMSFNADPNAGMTTDNFTGSAVVFQATVTFDRNSRRTAALR
jgi:hypothetical protein